jgi:pimeloyl-ACP methyl ester carboxylesterase
VLVGWSLGGVFARELAKRHPDLVAKVITMGSPFSGSPYDNNAWRVYHLVTGHSVEHPPIEAHLAAKPPVETVALWSPRDGIVAPRASCGKPGERDRAVALRCTHIGFANSPQAIRAVAQELERS